MFEDSDLRQLCEMYKVMKYQQSSSLQELIKEMKNRYNSLSDEDKNHNYRSMECNPYFDDILHLKMILNIE